MDLTLKVSYQVIIIFIYIAIGFILSKASLLKKDGVKQITALLLNIVSPCVLINSYQSKIDSGDPNLMANLGVAAILTLIIHLIAIFLVNIIFRKNEGERYKVNRFASIYSNCGFMAIPLLQAVLGADGVFYGSAYLAVFTLLYWTHGITVYTGSLKSVSVKTLILNPGVISTILSLTLFLLKIKLPQIIIDPVSELASLNTPLSMIVSGTYLASVVIKKALTRASLYTVSAIRLFIIPAILIGILILTGMILPIDSSVARTIIISASCPVAAVTALFAAKYDSDAAYASELVAITTLFSIITIPLILMLSALFI